MQYSITVKKPKTLIFIVIAILGIAFYAGSFLFMKTEKHCYDFTEWKDAQKNLAKYPSLDANHDTIACNSLLRGEK